MQRPLLLLKPGGVAYPNLRSHFATANHQVPHFLVGTIIMRGIYLNYVKINMFLQGSRFPEGESLVAPYLIPADSTTWRVCVVMSKCSQ